MSSLHSTTSSESISCRNRWGAWQMAQLVAVLSAQAWGPACRFPPPTEQARHVTAQIYNCNTMKAILWGHSHRWRGPWACWPASLVVSMNSMVKDLSQRIIWEMRGKTHHQSLVSMCAHRRRHVLSWVHTCTAHTNSLIHERAIKRDFESC